jgi:hypothetical protein
MWPATPPTMAPLMHPLASAGEIEASAKTHATARPALMVLSEFQVGPADQSRRYECAFNTDSAEAA